MCDFPALASFTLSDFACSVYGEDNDVNPFSLLGSLEWRRELTICVRF
jgi:hypothetical protein